MTSFGLRPLPASAPALGRRRFLRGGFELGAALWLASALPGCGGRPDEAYAPWSFPPDEAEPIELRLVAAALLAASPHNIQPWWFRVTPGTVELFHDAGRSLGVMDGLEREAFIGLGCAIENLVIAAAAFGAAGELTALPEGIGAGPVARLVLGAGNAGSADGALFDAIAKRHTNRGAYVEAPLAPGVAAELRRIAAGAGVHFDVLDAPDDKRAFHAATVAATEEILRDREMSEASHAWYRHSASDIAEHRDGTTLDATGAAWLTRQLGRATARPDAATAGEYWLDGTRGRQGSASAFVLLSTDVRDARDPQLAVGRAYQRMHLWATSVGLAMQPMNQLPERQDREQVLGLEPVFTELLAGVTGHTPSTVQMAFRIGYAVDPAEPAPRRPVAWVVRS